MKRLPALLGISAMLIFAAPVHADPDDLSGDDGGFLNALKQVGIDYANAAQAISAGKAVCTCLNNGESGLELIHDVKARNPGTDMEVASNFSMISAKFYCPQHLSKA